MAARSMVGGQSTDREARPRLYWVAVVTCWSGSPHCGVLAGVQSCHRAVLLPWAWPCPELYK